MCYFQIKLDRQFSLLRVRQQVYTFARKHFIAFDDIDKRKDRWMFDQFTAMRYIFERFKKNYFGCQPFRLPFIRRKSLSLQKQNIVQAIQSKQTYIRHPFQISKICSLCIYVSVQWIQWKPATVPSPYYIPGTTPIVQKNLFRKPKRNLVSKAVISAWTDYKLLEWLIVRTVLDWNHCNWRHTGKSTSHTTSSIFAGRTQRIFLYDCVGEI